MCMCVPKSDSRVAFECSVVFRPEFCMKNLRRVKSSEQLIIMKQGCAQREAKIYMQQY